MNNLLRTLCLAAATLSSAAWGQLTDTTVVTNRVSVPVSGAANWTDLAVRCPTGLAALSGGVDTNDFLSIEITTLAPTFGGTALAFLADGIRTPADGWYASVKNFGAVAHPVAISVVCAQLSDVIVSVNSATVGAGSTAQPGSGTNVAWCPSGYSAIGGGVDLALPASMKISGLAPRFDFEYLIDRAPGSGNAPDGWAAYVRSEGAAGTMKTAAVCTRLAGVTSVSTGPFAVGGGTATGYSAGCPAGAMALGGGIETNATTTDVTAVNAPRFGNAPQSPVDRESGSYSSATGWYGIYYNYSSTSNTGAVGIVCAPPTPGVALVYEFYNTGLRHYFRTANADEAVAIDQGAAGPNWMRTGDNFHAYAAGANAPGSDVCRFYTQGANSHFYTAFASECASLKAPGSGWIYEGLSFRIPLPAGSTCSAGTLPVYRLYNDRFAYNDSNHRFTTVYGNIAALQAQGWVYEGVAFCALNL